MSLFYNKLLKIYIFYTFTCLFKNIYGHKSIILPIIRRKIFDFYLRDEMCGETTTKLKVLLKHKSFLYIYVYKHIHKMTQWGGRKA